MVKPSVWRRANVGVAAAKRPAKLKKMKKASYRQLLKEKFTC